MTRLFVDGELQTGALVSLDGEKAHYLLHVLRRRPGDRLVLVDGMGRECEGAIEECGLGEVKVRVDSASGQAQPEGVAPELYCGVLKGKQLDLVVQKCTELGMARLVPVITARTISRPEDERAEGKTGRWRKIAEEACRQCRRTTVPRIEAPVSWTEALEVWGESGATGIIACEALAGMGQAGLREALQDAKPLGRLAAFVGPEGGFSPAEVKQAVAAGLRPVSLGPLILRAETAAIALCAVVGYEGSAE